MDLIKLKEYISKGIAPNKSIIFKYQDNTFIIDQYIKAISNIKHKDILYINDLKELNSDNPFLKDNIIYVFKTDKLETFSPNNNLIITCKSISKDIDVLDYTINIPKLEEWCIKDYINLKLPNLSKENKDWLYFKTKGDIYRIDKEIDKLNILSPKGNDYDINLLKKNYNYIDLNDTNIFDLSNSILKKDLNLLNNVLIDLKNNPIDPMALISILEKNFINVLNIQTNPKIEPEKINLTYKQFKALNYSCNFYTNHQILKILKFLFNLDFKIKSGKIPYNNILDYLIINIIGV